MSLIILYYSHKQTLSTTRNVPIPQTGCTIFIRVFSRVRAIYTRFDGTQRLSGMFPHNYIVVLPLSRVYAYSSITFSSAVFIHLYVQYICAYPLSPPPQLLLYLVCMWKNSAVDRGSWIVDLLSLCRREPAFGSVYYIHT